MSAFARCRPRRRGQELVRDLHRAALEEVADVGFDAMTFEKVAARAGAGKASVYKRWSTPAELLVDALEEADAEVLGRMEAAADPARCLRDELVAVHRGFAEGLETPAGRALLPLLAVRHQHPDFWDRVHALMVVPRQALVREAVQRAVAEGQIPPRDLDPLVLGSAARLLILHRVDRGHLSPEDVKAHVDRILLPALGVSWPLSNAPAPAGSPTADEGTP